MIEAVMTWVVALDPSARVALAAALAAMGGSAVATVLAAWLTRPRAQSPATAAPVDPPVPRDVAAEARGRADRLRSVVETYRASGRDVSGLERHLVVAEGIAALAEDVRDAQASRKKRR